MEGIQAVAARIQERALALNNERVEVAALDEELVTLRKIIKDEAKVSIIYKIKYLVKFDDLILTLVGRSFSQAILTKYTPFQAWYGTGTIGTRK